MGLPGSKALVMDIHYKLQAHKRWHMAALNFLLYKVKFIVITSVQNLESQQLD